MGTVSRKLGRPADTDSTDTRDRIVICARESFAAEGFEGTTNKEIAKRAGVSSTALYHYFPSKAELYVAVCDAITAVFAEAFEKAMTQHHTLEDRLQALFEEIGKLSTKSPSITGFTTGISTVVRRHPEVSRGANAFGSELRRMIIDLIRTSDEADVILGETTVEAFADLTGSVMAGMGRMRVRGAQSRNAATGEAFLHLVRKAAQS
jgi:AcrR family transcriptional regulator